MHGNVTAVTLSATDSPRYWMSGYATLTLISQTQAAALLKPAVMPIMNGTLPSRLPDGAANAAMDVLSEPQVWLPVTGGSYIAIGVDIEGVLETSFSWPRTLSPLQSPGFAMFGNVTAVTLSATDSPGYWMS